MAALTVTETTLRAFTAPIQMASVPDSATNRDIYALALAKYDIVKVLSDRYFQLVLF